MFMVRRRQTRTHMTCDGYEMGPLVNCQPASHPVKGRMEAKAPEDSWTDRMSAGTRDEDIE